MFLSNPNQLLTLSSNLDPVSALSVNIDYADHTSRIPVAGNVSLLVTGTSSVLLSGAPAPNQRQIKNISIFNPNILPIEITIKQTYPTQIIRKVETIEENQTLQYSEHKGWTLV